MESEKRAVEEEFRLIQAQIGKTIKIEGIRFNGGKKLSAEGKLLDFVAFSHITVNGDTAYFIAPNSAISSIRDESNVLIYENSSVLNIKNNKDNEVKRIHYANSLRRQKFGSGHYLPVLAENEFDLLEKNIGKIVKMSGIPCGSTKMTFFEGTLLSVKRYGGLQLKSSQLITFHFLSPVSSILYIEDESGDIIYFCEEADKLLGSDNSFEEKLHLMNELRSLKFGPEHKINICLDEEGIKLIFK